MQCDDLEQGCLVLLLNGQLPAEFSSNVPACKFVVIPKTLISSSRCVNWGGGSPDLENLVIRTAGFVLNLGLLGTKSTSSSTSCPFFY